jgi:anthranilate/para-aminobenzoate synthase component I/branched-subunit amino acid aminotransferase/4-amino-4-deoxychorismate lyase
VEVLSESWPAWPMTLNRLVSGAPRLGAMTARPYRQAIFSTAAPAAVIAQLNEDDHPGALWGEWFGGGVLIFRRPLHVQEPVDAPDGFAYLDQQPRLSGSELGSDVVGGGWLVCLGYDPKTTTLAFYDSLLRWQRDSGWSFESLGLGGRELDDAAALQDWRSLLSAAGSTATEPPHVGPFKLSMGSAPAQDRYLAAVEQVINRIDHGRFYQLNHCIRLHAEVGSTAPVIFGQLSDRLQPAFGGLITGPTSHGSSHMITSFSPELFLRIRDRTVMTAPIKGTAPRGADDSGAAALQASAKDAAENVMIVDLMRNDLSRVCRPGTVAVQDLLTIQPHLGVWHLVSAVRGELDPQATTAHVLAAAFPPGSVTGAPKISAQQGIAELEAEPRGAYTGSLGLVSPLAGADFNVIIRTFELSDGHLQLGVGGGITVDSVPMLEWYECLHKAAPLVAAAGSVFDHELTAERAAPDPTLLSYGVFESILVVRGKIIRLAAHLARLDRSCRELYGQGIPDDLAGEAYELVKLHADQPRLALRILARPTDGKLVLRVRARPLGPPPVSSALRHQSRPDRSWRHKWVERSALDEAEAAASPSLPFFTSPAQPQNITETSRGNLFIKDDDGVWCTPPLDEHVLPGVTRREVIDVLDDQRTPARIRRCSVQDLLQSRGAFWTSSLSGAVPIATVAGSALPDISKSTAELNDRLGIA